MNHMGNMLVSVILILAMLLLSAFFSGMEIAFVSKNRLKLEIDRRQNRVLERIAASSPQRKESEGMPCPKLSPE